MPRMVRMVQMVQMVRIVRLKVSCSGEESRGALTGAVVYQLHATFDTFDKAATRWSFIQCSLCCKLYSEIVGH